MKSQMRPSAWWIWLLPSLIGAALPMLVLGMLTTAYTTQFRFSLWGWSAAILILAVAVWAASRGLSYGLWLGLTAGVIGISLLIFHELIKPVVEDRTLAYRLPTFLSGHPDCKLQLIRSIGIGAMVVCVLFLVGIFISRRRTGTEDL